jgi:hypothetical protein
VLDQNGLNMSVAQLQSIKDQAKRIYDGSQAVTEQGTFENNTKVSCKLSEK